MKFDLKLNLNLIFDLDAAQILVSALELLANDSSTDDDYPMPERFGEDGTGTFRAADQQTDDQDLSQWQLTSMPTPRA